jgi:hypothetical protein
MQWPEPTLWHLRRGAALPLFLRRTLLCYAFLARPFWTILGVAIANSQAALGIAVQCFYEAGLCVTVQRNLVAPLIELF